MFKNKTLLITGGTGSFGNAVPEHYLKCDIGEIRPFSRDEKKQEDMGNYYKNSKIKSMCPIRLFGLSCRTHYLKSVVWNE